MASPRPPSSAIPGSTSLPTPIRSANPAPAPAASAAPTNPAPAPSASQPAREPASPTQQASVFQAVKSVPTTSTSSVVTTSSAKPSKPSGVPSNSAASPTPTSSEETSSGSNAASIWGGIFAVVGIVLALVACFAILRRRRQKSRRLWEAKRMPNSNFGNYEGEVIPEKPVNIEDTLAADLARLRNLDSQTTINFPQIYNPDASSRPSFDYSPGQLAPAGFKIARKPSLRVREHVALVRSPAIGDEDVTDSRESAPACDTKECIADFSSDINHIPSLPRSPTRYPDFH